MHVLLGNRSFDLSYSDVNVYKWKGADLRKWLASRGLPQKYLVHKLKDTINTYLSEPESIQEISSRYTCSIDLVT